MKNTRCLLANVLQLLLGVLVLVFLSQAYLTWQTGIIDATASGYSLIDFSSNDAKYVFIAIANLVATIVACLMILLAFYNLLKCLNVLNVKNKTCDKVINVTNLFLGLLALVFAVVGFICLCVAAGEFTTYHLGWAGIVNFVLLLVLAVCPLFGACKNKSKKRK